MPNNFVDERRKLEAMSVFRDYPGIVTLEFQRLILSQQVALGMDPYMTKLAGGEFRYQVDADPEVWPKNSDPLNVMWAQSLNPDSSRIWMTFENRTQYPGEGKMPFKVSFEDGVAISIEKLDADKNERKIL